MACRQGLTLWHFVFATWSSIYDVLPLVCDKDEAQAFIAGADPIELANKVYASILTSGQLMSSMAESTTAAIGPSLARADQKAT